MTHPGPSAPSLLDCTAVIADVRMLRAASLVPLVLGLTFLVVAVPLSWAFDDARQSALWAASSVALLVTAWSLRLGSRIAAFIPAAALIVVVILALSQLTAERRGIDVVPVVALFGAAAWLHLRAFIASLRLRNVAWMHTRPGIRSALAQLPRDERSLRAVRPLTAALAVYAAGAAAGAFAFLATGHGLFAGIAISPFAIAGSRLLQRARRTLALRVAEVRAKDPRPPLLLIRSFAADNLELEAGFTYFGALLHRRVTLEELIVDGLSAIGPIVAIGKPREGLSPLGAAREYVFGSGWQQRVTAVLEECSWVVAILGATSGLAWEYEQVTHRGLTGRFILVIPPADPVELHRRWHAFQMTFFPARALDLPPAGTKGAPLFATFLPNHSPVIFWSRHRNETAYSVTLSMVLARLNDASR